MNKNTFDFKDANMGTNLNLYACASCGMVKALIATEPARQEDCSSCSTKNGNQPITMTFHKLERILNEG